MKEGVFFPNFWTKEQVKHWVDVFIRKEIKLEFNQKDNQYWFSPDILRELNLENPDSFSELTQLLSLFGISVQVDQNEDVFKKFTWDRNTCVVVDPRPIEIEHFIEEHTLLISLSKFDALKSYGTLFGLILNQITFLDSRINLEMLTQIFNDSEITIIIPLRLTIFDSKRVKVDELFNYQHNALIINHFADAGVTYLDELTSERLQKIYKMPGIGKGKQKFIENKIRNLIDFELAEDIEVVDVNQSIPIKILFDENKDRLIINSFYKNGIQNTDQITPDLLNKIFNFPGIGENKKQKILATIKSAPKIIDKQINSPELFLPILPFSHLILKDEPDDLIITINEYLRLINTLLNKKKFVVSLKDAPEKIKNFVDNKEQDEQMAIIRKALAIYFKEDFDQYPDDLIERSWHLLNDLLPNSVEYYVNEFIDQLDERSKAVLKYRKMSSDILTLEELGEKWGITRERVRQIDKKVSNVFIQWWQNHNFTLKLLVLGKCQPMTLSKYFSEENNRLIESTIIDSDLNQYFLTSDDYLQMFVDVLLPILLDGQIHSIAEIKQVFENNHLELKADEFNQAIDNLNYRLDQDNRRLISTKRVPKIKIIEEYCSYRKTKIIDVDEYDQINEWSKEKLGYEAFPSLRAFQGRLSNQSEYIPIGKGKYKLFEKENYDLVIFERAKKLVDDHFADGYHYVRDAWLFEQLKEDLPKSMTTDEFYQIFQRLYPVDFVYSPGRNNDIFVLGSQPLTIGEQIVEFLKTQNHPVSLGNLKKQFGWANYTLQQEAAKNLEIVLNGQNVMWLDVNFAKEFLGDSLTDYLNRELKIYPILSLKIFYHNYIELWPEEAELTNTDDKMALASFINALNLDVEVSGEFILRKTYQPTLKREPADLWPQYLKVHVKNQLTLKEIKQIFIDAGMGEGTWNLRGNDDLKKSGLIPVSSKFYADKDNMKRNDTIDQAVQDKIEQLLSNQDFLAVNALTPDSFHDLPDVNFEWTPELLASFAEILGYNCFSWSGDFFKMPCYVVTRSTASYTSIEDVILKQIKGWMKDDNYEPHLYDLASSKGLVPSRNEFSKKCFPKRFYSSKNLEVDENRSIVLNTKKVLADL